jgi:chemotaxis protein MotB
MADHLPNQEPEQSQSVHEQSARRLPPWLITYSDLVTLLLTFFVLLMSMSSLDPVKFNQASSSLKSAFGIQIRSDPSNASSPVLPAQPQLPITPFQVDMNARVYQPLRTQLEKRELAQQVEVINQDKETVILRIGEHLLFKPGSDKLEVGSDALLISLAELINPLPVDLRIEGHTDDKESQDGQTIDSWDLSMARAASVARFFETHKLFELERISAIGYGPKRPVVPNTNRENRARNRRVDFVLRTRLPSGTAPASAKRSAFPL